jgi:hypothetical protein
MDIVKQHEVFCKKMIAGNVIRGESAIAVNDEQSAMDN